MQQQHHHLTLGPPSCAAMRARPSAAHAAPLPPPSTRRRRLLSTTSKPRSRPPNIHLRRLTSRIVELTRRRQLRQIFEEVKMAKSRHGRLNTIVMNAVMEACVHCGDVDAAVDLFEDMAGADGCGVDGVTFATLLKGLGKAGRIDEAFQILESVEQGTAAGSPKLSSQLIYGLLNALLEAGDMRRANGLLARYRIVLREEGHSILLYNLLMKGYTNTDFPLGALAVRDEILRQGLKPDRLTYNTLIFACVKSRRMDVAMGLFAEMQEESEKANNTDLFPDSVTYTTLIQGFGSMKDLLSVQKIVAEMKSSLDTVIDRIAYTAIIDALLACGSTKGGLCIFGEILKLGGEDTNLKPKPHLFLAMMREFAVKGDFHMVKGLHRCMWSDSVGVISPVAQVEADELLMEAAINSNQVHIAKQILSKIVRRQKWSSWTSRGGTVALRVEALSGFTDSLFSPCILNKVSLDDPIDKYMTTFEEAKPLHASLYLKQVVMRFYRDDVVPVIDDWGSCIGIVHCDDCSEVEEYLLYPGFHLSKDPLVMYIPYFCGCPPETCGFPSVSSGCTNSWQKLDVPLSGLMRGPPPCVTTSTSVGRVIELLLEKRYKMIIVVRSSNVYETSFSSSSRPVGVFTYSQLFKLTTTERQEPYACRTFTNS